MTNLETLLKEIEDRAGSATEGGWQSETNMVLRGEDFICQTHELNQEDNADFIAHARTDVPRLVRALRQTAKTLNEAVKHNCDCGADTCSDTSYENVICYEHQILDDITKILQGDSDE